MSYQHPQVGRNAKGRRGTYAHPTTSSSSSQETSDSSEDEEDDTNTMPETMSERFSKSSNNAFRISSLQSTDTNGTVSSYKNNADQLMNRICSIPSATQGISKNSVSVPIKLTASQIRINAANSIIDAQIKEAEKEAEKETFLKMLQTEKERELNKSTNNTTTEIPFVIEEYNNHALVLAASKNQQKRKRSRPTTTAGRAQAAKKTKSKREAKNNVIVCDTCENEYLLNDIGITLKEAHSLDEWSCGICLGTHFSTSNHNTIQKHKNITLKSKTEKINNKQTTNKRQKTKKTNLTLGKKGRSNKQSNAAKKKAIKICAACAYGRHTAHIKGCDRRKPNTKNPGRSYNALQASKQKDVLFSNTSSTSTLESDDVPNHKINDALSILASLSGLTATATSSLAVDEQNTATKSKTASLKTRLKTKTKNINPPVPNFTGSYPTDGVMRTHGEFKRKQKHGENVVHTGTTPNGGFYINGRVIPPIVYTRGIGAGIAASASATSSATSGANYGDYLVKSWGGDKTKHDKNRLQQPQQLRNLIRSNSLLKKAISSSINSMNSSNLNRNLVLNQHHIQHHMGIGVTQGMRYANGMREQIFSHKPIRQKMPSHYSDPDYSKIINHMNQERTSKQLEHRSATEATYRKKMRMKKVMETHLKYVLCKDENDPEEEEEYMFEEVKMDRFGKVHRLRRIQPIVLRNVQGTVCHGSGQPLPQQTLSSSTDAMEVVQDGVL